MQLESERFFIEAIVTWDTTREILIKRQSKEKWCITTLSTNILSIVSSTL